MDSALQIMTIIASAIGASGVLMALGGAIGYKLNDFIRKEAYKEIEESYAQQYLNGVKEDFTLFLDDGIYELDYLPDEGDWVPLYDPEGNIPWVLLRPLKQLEGRYTSLTKIDCHYDKLNKVPEKKPDHLKPVK